jgi:hypothetical protein
MITLNRICAEMDSPAPDQDVPKKPGRPKESPSLSGVD